MMTELDSGSGFRLCNGFCGTRSDVDSGAGMAISLLEIVPAGSGVHFLLEDLEASVFHD